jgi:carbamate kinase
VRAACKRAAIGGLDDLNRILAGEAGTAIAAEAGGIVCAQAR